MTNQNSEYEKSLMDHFARRQQMEKIQKEKQHKEQKVLHHTIIRRVATFRQPYVYISNQLDEFY